MGFWKRKTEPDHADAAAREATTPEARLEAWVSGRVQGVGFRYWTHGVATEHGLVGYAKNLPDGRVEIIAEGSRTGLQALTNALNSGDTAGSVSDVDSRTVEPTGEFTDFGVA